MIMAKNLWSFRYCHTSGERSARSWVTSVVDHAAHFFNRTVHKRLLFGRQRADRNGVQLLPVRVAGKQVCFPPGGARFNGLFSVRDISGMMDL